MYVCLHCNKTCYGSRQFKLRVGNDTEFWQIITFLKLQKTVLGSFPADYLSIFGSKIIHGQVRMLAFIGMISTVTQIKWYLLTLCFGNTNSLDRLLICCIHFLLLHVVITKYLWCKRSATCSDTESQELCSFTSFFSVVLIELVALGPCHISRILQENLSHDFLAR